MALPALTPEQRAEALAKARQARKERSEFLQALKAGTLSLGDALARTDDVARRTKVAQVLKALPGYGPVKVAEVMEQTGIDERRRLGSLGEHQREKLLTAIAAATA